jgi:hypothetical protein
MTAYFAFPERAHFGERLNRDKLFRQAGGSKAIRSLYEQQVDRIDWAFKLFQKTVNLPPSNDVNEINVFRVTLRGPTLDDRVLAHFDKAIPQRTWFELIRESPDGPEVQIAAAYKRRSDADRAQMVTLEHARSRWAPATAPRSPLPTAISLEGLYAAMLRVLWPHGPRADETLRAQAERLSNAHAQAKAVARLTAQVRRERDYAAQIDRNRELRAAQAAWKDLTDPA